jgi:hypothetical protein
MTSADALMKEEGINQSVAMNAFQAHFPRKKKFN